MIEVDKIKEIGERLLEKSKSGNVNWKRGDNFTDDYQTFAVEESSLRIMLSFASPRAADDYFNFRIHYRNNCIGSITATENELPALWLLLHSLHEDARRVVTGWDVGLAELEKALDEDRPLGRESVSEDDIPF